MEYFKEVKYNGKREWEYSFFCKMENGILLDYIIDHSLFYQRTIGCPDVIDNSKLLEDILFNLSNSSVGQFRFKLDGIYAGDSKELISNSTGFHLERNPFIDFDFDSNGLLSWTKFDLNEIEYVFDEKKRLVRAKCIIYNSYDSLYIQEVKCEYKTKREIIIDSSLTEISKYKSKRSVENCKLKLKKVKLYSGDKVYKVKREKIKKSKDNSIISKIRDFHYDDKGNLEQVDSVHKINGKVDYEKLLKIYYQYDDKDRWIVRKLHRAVVYNTKENRLPLQYYTYDFNTEIEYIDKKHNKFITTVESKVVATYIREYSNEFEDKFQLFP